MASLSGDSAASSTAQDARATTQAGVDAFEAFFWLHERAILGYLWRLTGDEQTAHDLSQETFVRAWQHFDKLQHYDQPRAWLFRVATNLGINHLRGRARRPVAPATPAALGISHGSLKMALWRGRERFRQDYQRTGGAE